MNKVEAYLKVTDVARYTGLNVEGVRELIDKGELTAMKLNGQVKIKKSEIDRWLDEQVTREGLLDLAKKVDGEVDKKDIASALDMDEEELEEKLND
ncbi:MAG: helix-turn-helix domain-containing protein [Candidatus Bipolaricaulota bacterium]